MLLKLLPEQISTHWDVIRDSVERSMPPMVGDDPDMARVLEVLLTGEMQCWAAYRPGDKSHAVGFVLTTIVTDYCSGAINLLVYSVASFEKTISADWLDGFDALVKYAKEFNCKGITAFVKEEKLIEIAKRFGAEVSTFISIPI